MNQHLQKLKWNKFLSWALRAQRVEMISGIKYTINTG